MRLTGALWRKRFGLAFGILSVFLIGAILIQGTAKAPAQEPAPAASPAQTASVSTEELLRQMQQLRQEVEELRKSQTQPAMLSPTPPGIVSPPGTQPVMLLPTVPNPGGTLLPPGMSAQNGDGDTAPPAGDGTSGGGSSDDTADPGAGLPEGEGPSVPGSGDNFPFTASYRYNAGGGYTHIGTKDDMFTLNIQNLISLDGTFYDKASINTTEKGFNIPFARNYLFGNITKDWDYQIAFEETLGSFNILDEWVNYRHSDQLNVRFGRMVTPFLYEYLTIWPGWGPVNTLSPISNIAGRRHEGVMAWGRLFDKKVQYQQGVFNSTNGSFYSLDRNVNYIGALDFTPWKGSKGWLENFGIGFSAQIGLQQYDLDQNNNVNFAIGAGEPTTNFAYTGSTGVSFLQYVDTMIASGMQTRVAPHIYYFNQFSFILEYANQQRQLANTATGVQGLEQVNGYYLDLSYFLTGEKYAAADGFSSFTAIAPIRPLSPSQNLYGPGAWELGLQYSQLWINKSMVTDGFVDPLINATQLNQLMTGVNWYVNKYVKFSFNWMNDRTNKPVPLGTNGHLSSEYNTYWGRITMYF